MGVEAEPVKQGLEFDVLVLRFAPHVKMQWEASVSGLDFAPSVTNGMKRLLCDRVNYTSIPNLEASHDMAEEAGMCSSVYRNAHCNATL